MHNDDSTELPYYVKKAIDLGLIASTGNGTLAPKTDVVDQISLVAEIVDKLQPASALSEENTIDKEAIVLANVLTAGTDAENRKLWMTFRSSIGITQEMMVPLILWSTPEFKAIAREIDRIYLGQSDTTTLYPNSLNNEYVNTHESARSVSITDFTRTVNDLVNPNTLLNYGHRQTEWESALDILRKTRVNSIVKTSLHKAMQNIKASKKVEESCSYLQDIAAQAISIMGGCVGAQGSSVDLLDALSGVSPDGRSDILSLLKASQNRKKPVSTGLLAFDIDSEGGVSQDSSGGEGGRVFTLAARTGVGKTTFGVSISTSLACDGIDVGFISLELSFYRIVKKILSAISRRLYGERNWRVSQDKCGYITEAELRNIPQGSLEDVFALIKNIGADWKDGHGKFLIEAPSTGADVHNVIQIMRQMKAKNPHLRFVVLDHFHHMLRHKNGSHNQSENLGERANLLHKAALELNIDLLILAQCNQVGIKENRQDLGRSQKKPQLDWIRGTDVLGHVSDSVWILCKYIPSDEEVNQQHALIHSDGTRQEASQKKIEVWHCKQRNGQYVWNLNHGEYRIQPISKEIEKSMVTMNYSTAYPLQDDTDNQIPRRYG